MRTLRQKAVAWLSRGLLVAVAAVAVPAAAQQSDAERTAAARALFEQGMEAVDASDFETAADRLARSLDLRDSPVVRTNLALALIELGRLVEASEHLRRVQRDTEDGSTAHRVATARLAEIEPRLGQLQIDVAGATHGVDVLLDGQPVASALIGVPQPADPGEHSVSLQRLDREIASTTVEVEPGHASVVELAAPPPTAEEVALMEGSSSVTQPVQPAGPEPGVEEQWWFWTLIAVLAVGAGVGIGVGVWAATTPQEPWLEGFNNITFTLGEAP